MAISLKKLYLLDEYWVKTDVGDSGGEHWEPKSGHKLYHTSDIDVTVKGAGDSSTRKKSTTMFYDFYAMELLHAMLGTTKEMPTGAKIRATLPTAAKTGMNPAMIGVNWDAVTFPLSGIVLPEKLRLQIDQMYEEVTLELSHKLQEHLRRSLIQELRHLIGHSTNWGEFRNAIVSTYNKNKGSLSVDDFNNLVKRYLPNMVKYTGAVKRLLLFCRYYSKMSALDPGDMVNPQKDVEKDDPSTYYDVEKDPKAIDISKKKEKGQSDLEKSVEDEPEEPEEPEPTSVEEPPESGPESWRSAQYKLKEDYASGKISPSTIRKINIALHKAGVTWEDIVLAYKNIDWNGGYGGEKWGEGVVAYLKLVEASKTQDIEKISSMIDHIYDLSHNNGPLLNKGGMFVGASDLDRRSKVTHIARFLPDVSPSVKQMLLRFMHYLPDTNVEVEKNIDSFLKAPTIPFTPEQQNKLKSYHIGLASNKFGSSPEFNNSYVVNASFTNKQENYVDRYFLIKAHANGKFSIEDNIKADSKVFDTFEQLDIYIRDVLSKDMEPSDIPNISSPTPQYSSAKSLEVGNYIQTHTKAKVDSEKAKLLLEYCKMGWRSKGQYYKAYFPGTKRVMFYAFTDGSYLLTTNGMEFYKITSSWEEIFEETKNATKDAIPYPDIAGAQAHISGTGVQQPTSPQSTTPPAVNPGPVSTATPALYTPTGNDFPLHSTSPAAYVMHSGISAPPKNTIRLTQLDEDKITKIGFLPKMFNGELIYVHKGWGDTVKFYPNNVAKLSFSQGVKVNVPVVSFPIPKMLIWLPQKYNASQTVYQEQKIIHQLNLQKKE